MEGERKEEEMKVGKKRGEEERSFNNNVCVGLFL